MAFVAWHIPPPHITITIIEENKSEHTDGAGGSQLIVIWQESSESTQSITNLEIEPIRTQLFSYPLFWLAVWTQHNTGFTFHWNWGVTRVLDADEGWSVSFYRSKYGNNVK